MTPAEILQDDIESYEAQLLLIAGLDDLVQEKKELRAELRGRKEDEWCATWRHLAEVEEEIRIINALEKEDIERCIQDLKDRLKEAMEAEKKDSH